MIARKDGHMMLDSGKYKLDGRNIVLAKDIHDWAIAFEDMASRRVAEDTIGDVRISTVFLGLDHGFGQSGQPVLFETMVFGGKFNDHTDRCCTYDQAEEMHRKVVNMVLNGQEEIE